MEDRLTPAGNVSTSLLFGNLVVTGDSLANQITLSQPSFGQLTLTPDGATSINGGVAGTPVTISSLTGSVTLNMGGGDDTVVFDLTNTINLPLDLTINGGAGNNTIDNANATAATSLNIFHNLAIVNGAGNDSAFFVNLNVNGSASIQNGDGANTTHIAALAGTNSIGGNFSILNGRGFDDSEVSDTNVGGSVNINNGNGGATNGFSRTEFEELNSGVRLRIGGNFTLTDLSGTDISRLLDTNVGGSVFASYGSGISDFTVGGAFLAGYPVVRGNVTIAGTGAYEQGVVGSGAAGAGITVLGNLSITTGNQADSFFINGATVAGSTTINSGGGNDTVSFGGATCNGQLLLNTGDGADQVNFRSFAGVPNTFNGLVNVNTGAGNDTINVGFFANDASTFNRSVTMNLGAGDDVLNLALTGSATFFGTATFDGSLGNDTLNVNPANINAVFVNPVFLNFP